MPDPLAAHRDTLALRVRSAPFLLLFTDFDGTLVPIKERPMECTLDADVRDSLSVISRQDRTAVAVVSGRDLADLRPRVGVDGIAYAGNHGLEIEGPGLSFREPVALQLSGELSSRVAELTAALADIPGAWVQNKGLSASVHYRQVEPDRVPRVLEVVRHVMAPARKAGRFVLRSGKMVEEIRPAVDWHKGRAVQWLTERLAAGVSDPLSIYLGDDRTDEDAFAALPGGVTVHVGTPHDTAARYWVESPRDVARFLSWLATYRSQH